MKRLSTIRLFPLADLSRAKIGGNGKGWFTATMKTRNLLALCATLSLIFILALTLSATAFHGSVSKTTTPSGKTLAGTPVPPDDDDDTGNVQIAGTPVPPDDDDDTGNVKIAGTPVPPDDDDDTGNVRVASVQVISSARP